ncbi:hypothetical protein PG987_005946 [Apiospora arundinis]
MSTPWRREDVPDEDSPQFQKLLFLAQRSSFEPKAYPWKDAPNRKTWSALGDRGTTAMVGAYGDLIQFGTYIGRGQSGMFTADRRGSEDPDWVEGRTSKLLGWAEGEGEFDEHYGLTIFEASPIPSSKQKRVLPPRELPDLSWINYRWPQFTTTEETDRSKLETTTQWIAHEGMILQRVQVHYSGPGEVHLRFRIPKGDDIMEIRDLDHISVPYGFLTSSHYGSREMLGPNQYSWVFTHKLRQKEPQDADENTEEDANAEELQESIAVITSVMQDGKVLQWTDTPEETPSASPTNSTESAAANSEPGAPTSKMTRSLGGTMAENRPHQEWDGTLTAEGNRSTEIVVAYKMMLMPKHPSHSWESFTISAESMNVSNILSQEDAPLETLWLSKTHENIEHGDPPRSLPETPQSASEHIEFLVRRQLEHILSNCSIPLEHHIIGKDPEEKSSENHEAQPIEEGGTVPVALTCGDISFHRVCGSASFFAFAFLVEVQRRLQDPSLADDPYVRSLSRRVKSVCQGHIHWLRTVAREHPEKGFGANYWANGDPIKRGYSETWVAKDSLLDTAFHIIKVDDYSKLDPDFGATAWDSVKVAVGHWMTELREKEHRKSFAWPHEFESLPNFRLDEHVWIWRALKATDLDDNEASKESVKRFSHQEVQREILRRFTTPNDDVSGKRMLAVTRSCRETRFLFHARDTALFHALEWGLPLNEPPFQELWTNTIDSQSRHDENHEEQWDNALRYALAVVMGCRGHSLNKRSPQDLLKSSLRTLLESSSPNGLFAGQLNATTKKPICFFRESDRDFHFHCTFEIPYILLVYSSCITEMRSEVKSEQKKPGPATNAIPGIEYVENIYLDIFSTLASFQGNTQLPLSHQRSAGLPGALIRSIGKPVVFKKRQPFYRLLDSTNIFEIEEEWLYNYPAFLEDSSITSGSNAHSLMMNHLLGGIDLRDALKRTLSSQVAIALDIVQHDEELRTRLCDTLLGVMSIVFGRRKLLSQIILAISRGVVSAEFASIHRHARELRQSLYPVLLEFARLAKLEPEEIDTIQSSHSKEDKEDSPGSLHAPPASRTPRRWHTLRTSTSIKSDPAPEKSTNELFSPDDRGIDVLERLLAYDELKRYLRNNFMGRYIDVFVLVGSKFPAFMEHIAGVLCDNDGLLPRVILGNRSLYKGVREVVSEDVANGSRIRNEIFQYFEKLLLVHPGASSSIEDLPRPNGPQQPDVRSPSKGPFTRPLPVPDDVIFGDHPGAFVVDTSKKLSQGREQKAHNYEYNEFSWGRIPNDKLWDRVLRVPRKPQKAKKRFIWLSDADMTTALLCFLGSPQVERDPMSLFFDRHFNYELWFFDDTTPHLNTWETELHISFYQVLEPKKTPPTGIPTLFRESFPGKSPCDLTKASMGFRFFGDFFDRYWTCHFIEYVPSEGPKRAWDLPFENSNSRSTTNREWKQRKVLELYLFERIVAKVVRSTREIYERVREGLDVSGEVFSMVALDSGDYFSSSENWQKCQETLQVVEDRLEHIFTEIAKWNSRETDRGSERPRWTRSDERKYSSHIKKRLQLSNNKVRDLRRLKADITVLKDLLMSRQDQIRNDLALKSDENIRFFTYVTVVFLPLGFAASIFSMSEVPDAQLIGNMAIVAAVALILTAFALTTNWISRKLPGMWEGTMKRSYLANRKAPGTKQPPRTPGSAWLWLMKPREKRRGAYEDMNKRKPADGGVKKVDWTFMTRANVVAAFFLLPHCLFIWLVQVIAYNAMDLLKRLWRILGKLLEYTPHTGKDLFKEGFLASVVSPDSDSLRPFRLGENSNGKTSRKEHQAGEVVSPVPLEPGLVEKGEALAA